MHPLRVKRKQAGLTIGALAARAGLSQKQLERIERGESRMRVEETLRLAAELGCELSEIIPPTTKRKSRAAS